MNQNNQRHYLMAYENNEQHARILFIMNAWNILKPLNALKKMQQPALQKVSQD